MHYQVPSEATRAGTLCSMSMLSVVWVRSGDPSAADRLARAEVASSCGIPVEAVSIGRLCVRCGSGGHGRPVVRSVPAQASPAVSLARAPGVVLVSVRFGASVGVDVERVDAFNDDLVADVLLHPRESAVEPAALATTWVRKEALLKTTGQGLAIDPSSVWLSAPDAAPRILGWPQQVRGEVPTWVMDLRLGPELRAAAAGTGCVPDKVKIRQADPGELLG